MGDTGATHGLGKIRNAGLETSGGVLLFLVLCLVGPGVDQVGRVVAAWSQLMVWEPEKGYSEG